MPIVVINDVKIKVGETFDVNAYKKDWGDSIYNWTSFNTNIATVNSRGKVTGVSEGETEVKASINTLIFGWEVYSVTFKVEVTEEELPDPTDDDYIKCGEYDVYPGDEFTLKLNGNNLAPNDIRANGNKTISVVPEEFTKANGNEFKFTVSENAEAKSYRIEYSANNPNKGKVYYWIINVLENKVDLILQREDDENPITVQEDYCTIDEAANKTLEELKSDLINYLDGYTLEAKTIDNNGNIVVIANKVRYTVELLNANNEPVVSFEVKNGDSLNREQIGRIEVAAESLVPQRDQDYNYVLDYVAINDAAKTQFDLESTIAADVELVVVYHPVAIEKVDVSFYQRKGSWDKPNDVKLDDRQTITMEKAVVGPMADEALVNLLANSIGNNVVAEIIRDDAEYKVVLRSNRYRFVYLEDGDDPDAKNRPEIKDNRGEYYVLDRVNDENYTKEQEYDENAAAIIKEFGLDASIRIEGSEESWIHKLTKYFTTYKEPDGNDNYTRYNLWFTKKIENPIDIEHRIYFNNVAMSDDQDAKKYPTETIIVEEAGKTVEQEKIDHKDAEAVKAAYIKYALPTCHVDENYLGVDSVKYVATDNGAKIVITYWAKRINVQYEGFDEEGKSIGQIKDEWHKIVNYMDYDHAEMGKYLNVLDENNKPQTISFNGVQYRLNADKSEVVGMHSCTGTTGKKDDYNVVTIKLAYDFDVQANCEHEFVAGCEDDGADHIKFQECTKCQLRKDVTHEDHHYTVKYESGLKCTECGHNRTFETTIEATPKALPDFSEERMTRILGEAKEEFVSKTNAYFESIAEPNEKYAPVKSEDLENLNMELVESTYWTQRYEGVELVNDVYVKYVLDCSLMSSGSGSKKTKIKDPLVAQGSELLNDLRTNRPNDLITRAEFVGVLANIFQVPEDRIYDKAWNLEECTQREQIERLATYYIVKGYSDDEFGQNDTITTEQMYTIIARALKFQAKVKAMSDDEIKAELAKVSNGDKVADWAAEGVSIALKVGIAAATETAPTEPQNGVMRMTAADTLQKYIEIVAAPTAEAETELKVVEG
ncbi:MAG: Ig-like domain-containing protein [Clostridia bacterium]|nr:Ig-like domain-containing protein [Clostridia bacterium]